MHPKGLVHVPTDDLKRLLALLHRGELGFPLTPWEVARTGFQAHMEDLLGVLRELDGKAVRAVLVAVLSERLAEQERRRHSA